MVDQAATEARGGDARKVVDAHQASVPAAVRRRNGVHYTPGDLSRRVVEMAVDALGRVPESVCDPCCGAGSMLLAAADALHAVGVPAAQVPTRLIGADVDPGAVRAARSALEAWAVHHGAGGAAGATLVVADTLTEDPARWLHGCRRPDVVVGNPPFLTPLRSETAAERQRMHVVRSRLGTTGAYTDAAGLHLLSALQIVEPGGVVALVQPHSVLGSRDATPVRAAVEAAGSLRALWGSDRRLFDAQVAVCVVACAVADAASGPARRPSGPARLSTDAVRVRWDGGEEVTCRVPSAATWSPLAHVARGGALAPEPEGGALVGDVARATSGFRDEFYALAQAAVDEPDTVGADATSLPGGRPRLVTVGMVDPAELLWGRREFRLAGRRWAAPRLDLEDLERSSPRVAGWARARMVPKALVGSQGRVVEVVSDPEGSAVPVTPVVSVEPTTAGVTADMLAAAIGAPSSSARVVAAAGGTGLGPTSVRVSATAVAALPVPVDRDAWRAAADAWSSHDPAGGPDAWRGLGRCLDRALGVHDEEVLEWWVARLPAVRRRGGT